MGRLKSLWRGSSIFSYAMVERDKWIAEQAASIPAGSLVLDVGAGTAPYKPLFKDCDYRTQDIGSNKPDQMRYKEDYAELDYVCDIKSIPVGSQTFDAALCTEVLEHVPDPVGALQEIGRVLKPGGTLLCTFPLWNPVHYAPNHFYGGFSPYWISKYFDENGFDVVTLDKLGGYFKYYGLNSQRFARRLAPQIILKSKLAQLAYLPVWTVIAGWFMVVVPFCCHFLDPLDKTMDWTLGYMVVARKRDKQIEA